MLPSPAISARILAVLALSSFSCGDDAGLEFDESPAIVESCPVVVPDANCDKTLRPIVFVHGTFGSGDNIAHVAQLFGSNGYCQDRFVAIEYNSLGSNPVAPLDALIDEIRTKTGQDKVELMGHSQGTSHCTNYLKDTARAAKVAHYVNLSGESMVPNNVPTLSLSSKNDINGEEHHAPNAEKKVTFENQDHFGVASSDEAFAAIYSYLMGRAPAQTEVACGEPEITFEGIAETFGDNVPFSSGKLDIYELGTEIRDRKKPRMTVTADANGHVGPIQLKRSMPYEFAAYDGAGVLVGHIYFAPFKRSNRLARLLSPSKNPLVSALSTDNLKRGPNHAVVVARNIRGAFRFDQGDSLKVNGSEVLTNETAGRTNTTVGLLMSDQNENLASDLGVAFQAPFIFGTDVFMDARTPAFIELNWKGTVMKIPNWPSDQGLISVLFP